MTLDVVLCFCAICFACTSFFGCMHLVNNWVGVLHRPGCRPFGSRPSRLSVRPRPEPTAATRTLSVICTFIDKYAHWGYLQQAQTAPSRPSLLCDQADPAHPCPLSVPEKKEFSGWANNLRKQKIDPTASLNRTFSPSTPAGPGKPSSPWNTQTKNWLMCLIWEEWRVTSISFTIKPQWLLEVNGVPDLFSWIAWESRWPRWARWSLGKDKSRMLRYNYTEFFWLQSKGDNGTHWLFSV